MTIHANKNALAPPSQPCWPEFTWEFSWQSQALFIVLIPGSPRVKDKRHGHRRHHERSIDPRLEIYISTGYPTTATLPDGYDTDSAAVSAFQLWEQKQILFVPTHYVEYLDKLYSVTIKNYSQREHVNRSNGKQSLRALRVKDTTKPENPNLHTAVDLSDRRCLVESTACVPNSWVPKSVTTQLLFSQFGFSIKDISTGDMFFRRRNLR
jgi:hypothetical protein